MNSIGGAGIRIPANKEEEKPIPFYDKVEWDKAHPKAKNTLKKRRAVRRISRKSAQFNRK